MHNAIFYVLLQIIYRMFSPPDRRNFRDTWGILSSFINSTAFKNFVDEYMQFPRDIHRNQSSTEANVFVLQPNCGCVFKSMNYIFCDIN